VECTASACSFPTLAELERAYQLQQGVTDRERRRIEAEFYDLQERYDEKAQSLRVLVSLYPVDVDASRGTGWGLL